MCLTRICFIFLFLIFFVAGKVSAQNYRLSEHIKNVAITLDSSALSEYAPFDLADEMDSNFKVLGIGEQSHGTSEFFKARISLIKSFVNSGGLTKIGLEAPFAEVENLNAYILDGTGDIQQILKSFRLFNYECKEFVDLVENIRLLNASRQNLLTFFGIDMQTPFQALQNLSESCTLNGSAASDSIKKLTEYYRLLDNKVYNHAFSREDFAELSDLSNYIFNKLSRDACLQKDLVCKSKKNYEQFLLLNHPGSSYETKATTRDSLMAENIINEMEPGGKIVILAHNGHVQRTPNVYSKSMGFFLSRRLGAQYQCIALTTSTGFYTAFTPAARKVTDQNAIPVGEAGTFEYEFSKIQKPIFFFKTAKVKKQNAAGNLPNKYKLLPFGLTDQPFVNGNLLDDFNYVLHIEKTLGNQSFYLTTGQN